MKRFLLGLSLALLSTLSVAATHVPTPDETLAIGYPTVEAAQTGLSGRSDVKVFSDRGFVRAEVPGVAVEWLFVPKDDPAYPSLIKLVGVVSGAGQAGVSVICGASQAACDTFIAKERADAQKRGKLFQATVNAN